MPVFICESFSIKSQSEQAVVIAVGSVKLLLCPLLEVIFSLPLPLVTKTWNLTEPKDMGKGSTNSASGLLGMILGMTGERGHSYFPSLVSRHIYSSC